jgi:hypothetical protein
VINAEVRDLAQPTGVDENVGWLDVALKKKKKKNGDEKQKYAYQRW